MPLPPLLHQYSRSKPIFKKKAIANGVAIATVYCNLAIAVHIVLQDTPLWDSRLQQAFCQAVRCCVVCVGCVSERVM